MKKALLSLLFVAGVLVAFSSCKKEFDCTCTQGISEPYTTTAKGDDAAEACAKESSVLTLKVCVPADE